MSSQEQVVNFNNGEIKYNSSRNGVLYDGEIIFAGKKIYYDKIIFKQNGNIREYQFGVGKNTPNIFESSDILKGSTGTIYVENDDIVDIKFGHTKISRADEKMPILIESFQLNNKGEVNKIKNGYFLFGDDFKFNIEQENLQKVTNKWGSRRGFLGLAGWYYYNKTYEKDFTLKTDFLDKLNIRPNLKLNGELNISPEYLRGKGKVGFTIFNKPIDFAGVKFPKFLTRNNPYEIEGEISYDYVRNLFRIKSTRTINSGNIILKGSQSIELVPSLTDFAFKLEYEGKLKYDLKDVVRIMNNNNVGLTEIGSYNSNMPVDERVFLWAMQFVKSNEEIIALHQKNGSLEEKVKLTIIFGYDTEAAGQDNIYKEWNLLKVNIKFGDDKVEKEFKL